MPIENLVTLSLGINVITLIGVLTLAFKAGKWFGSVEERLETLEDIALPIITGGARGRKR